jgi:hypothetical protein
VDLVHELVEVQPPLLGDRRNLKKEIHEQCLAAPHLAHEVGTAQSLAAAQEPEEPAPVAVRGKPRRDAVEDDRRAMLPRIVLQGPAGFERSERIRDGTVAQISLPG